jgi:phage tail-like protein
VAELLLATTHRFRVQLLKAAGPTGAPDQLGDGGFQECTGLEAEMDVSEYAEGGRTDGVLQRVGRAKWPRLVLKRGLLHAADGEVDPALWTWFADVVAGVRPVRRYDGVVDVMGAEQRVVARWAFRRALPAKIVGPQLNARTGDVAVEELQLVHEGLRLVTS